MAAHYPLLLVDASSYLFRAYHALPKLTNSSGEPTGAVTGVIAMLRRLIDSQRPDYVGVVFDAPGKTFRHERYADYKAHRPPMPEELRAQIEPLHAVIRALGLPLLAVAGVEADDVIGTLAESARRAGIRTLIATGDKDMAQLVDAQVHLIDTMTDTLLDAEGVKAKYGVPPERIVDYLSLMGDSSDNIPGVPKCGPKTAVKWLGDYGSLDALIAQAESVKGKIGESLRASLEQIPLARELTTIRRDVPLDLTPTDLRPASPDLPTLRAWYQRFEARKLLAGLENAHGEDTHGAADDRIETPPAAPAALDYEVILDAAALDAWSERLNSAELIALDTETTSLDYMQAELVGISFALEPGRAAYVPLAHSYPGAPEQLDRTWVLERLRPLLEDPARLKVGQNLKYDMSVLARHGIALGGIAHDTLLESYVLDSTANRHDLDTLAKRHLDHDTIRFADIAGKGAKQLGFAEIPLEQAAPYAAEDAEVCLRLHRTLWPQLKAEPALAALYRDIEMPLLGVLSRIERRGVRIDCAALAVQSQQLAERILELEREAQDIAGHPFNLGSPKQIGAILFEEQGLPVVAKTPKGAPSTSEEVLEQLASAGHALPRVILEHRGLSKLRSTYTDKLPRLVDPVSGRVHTSYHQAVTATGRLSSSDPNLQNIPIRTEEGRRIRRAFIAEPGYRLLAADYSQIELRIMAHLSGDARLLEAFASGQDIHRATAAEIHGIAPEAVSSEQRRAAKAINFGLIYGMSPFGLARQLGIERGMAQAWVERYFERYPGVRAFMERTREQARAERAVHTLFGRRLRIEGIEHRNPNQRAAAERAAINAPMQGSAADIIKRAMIAVDDWIETQGAPVRMIMQVHDELVFEVADAALEEARARIRALMEGAAELAVPLVVAIGEGTNWEEAH
ncbi:MAG: DNA polymerase I [Chromatiaceae bacterium]|nr:DNA polymerase I [Chromatiaceae bacterium]